MLKQHPPIELLIGQFLCLIVLFLVVTPNVSCAEVWSCAEGYTDHPEGKTSCQRVGASAVCATTGDRYFTRASGVHTTGSTNSCNHDRSAQGGFFSYETLKGVSYAKKALYDKLTSSLVSTKKYLSMQATDTKQNHKTRVGDPQYQDIFSCFTTGIGLGECSIAELTGFVENSFMQAGEALK
jgi:hypothetical protein